MKSIPVLLALLIGFGLVSIVTAQVGQSPQGLCAGAEPGELTTMQFAEAENVIDQTLDYRAILCTSAGAVYVDLYEKLTPTTVNNFVFLAQLGYYDNTSFHRVIPEFMVQGGDPTATGRGGPGYQFQDEPVGFLTFDRPGLLAMANAGPGTNGSQFFVTTVPTPHLNYKHTIFGDVLLGQDNVLSIRERDPQTASGPGETLQTVLIITDRRASTIALWSMCRTLRKTRSLPRSRPLSAVCRRPCQLMTRVLACSRLMTFRQAFLKTYKGPLPSTQMNSVSNIAMA